MPDLSGNEIDALLDLLREQADTVPDSGGALSLIEWAEKMGCHPQTLRGWLRPLLQSGQAECVKVKKLRVDGTRCTYPAYRLKGAG